MYVQPYPGLNLLCIQPVVDNINLTFHHTPGYRCIFIDAHYIWEVIHLNITAWLIILFWHASKPVQCVCVCVNLACFCRELETSKHADSKTPHVFNVLDHTHTRRHTWLSELSAWSVSSFFFFFKRCLSAAAFAFSAVMYGFRNWLQSSIAWVRETQACEKLENAFIYYLNKLVNHSIYRTRQTKT